VAENEQQDSVQETAQQLPDPIEPFELDSPQLAEVSDEGEKTEEKESEVGEDM